MRAFFLCVMGKKIIAYLIKPSPLGLSQSAA